MNFDVAIQVDKISNALDKTVKNPVSPMHLAKFTM